MDVPIFIELWDKKKDGNDQKLGETELTLNDMKDYIIFDDENKIKV